MTRRTCVRNTALAGLGAISTSLLLANTAHATPWSFGVMSDTQWNGSAGTAANPNSVAVSIIKQINTQMINAGVKFVVQVGDLTDNGTAAALATRAQGVLQNGQYVGGAQQLLNAGIGFFPLRGNHESGTGVVGATKTDFPQMTGASNTFGATNFQLASSAGLNSLSYSFDYNNAQFVMLDQFATANPPSSGTNISDQLSWMNTVMSTDPSQQTFVFSHKNLIGGNHLDTLFGADPSVNTIDPSTGVGVQDAFFADLQNNGVQYYLSGHDHMYQRSVITSPDGKSQVTQIIDGSDSNKFYVPAGTDPTIGADIGNTLGETYGNRQTILAQSLYHVGYTIFTVDGANVTGRYYDAAVGATYDAAKSEYTITATPTMTFQLVDTFGSTVPEPASLALLASALGLLGFARRRTA